MHFICNVWLDKEISYSYDSNKKLAPSMQIIKIEHNLVISTNWYSTISICCTVNPDEVKNLSSSWIISNRFNISVNPDWNESKTNANRFNARRQESSAMFLVFNWNISSSLIHLFAVVFSCKVELDSAVYFLWYDFIPS